MYRKENRTVIRFQSNASILFYFHSSTSSTSINNHAQDGILVAAKTEAVATMTVTISPAPALEAVTAVLLSPEALVIHLYNSQIQKQHHHPNHQYKHPLQPMITLKMAY